MRRVHFYHKESGVLHPRAVVLNVPPEEFEKCARLNAPADHEPIEGDYDAESQRVVVESRTIVDWQPPAPGPDHEWNAAARRWLLSAPAAERERRRITARARVQELELAQARRIRELLADSDPRLKAIDQEIAALRADL
jgi:hypothetical protein